MKDRKVTIWEQARRNMTKEANEKGFKFGSPERLALFKEKYTAECLRLRKEIDGKDQPQHSS